MRERETLLFPGQFSAWSLLASLPEFCFCRSLYVFVSELESFLSKPTWILLFIQFIRCLLLVISTRYLGALFTFLPLVLFHLFILLLTLHRKKSLQIFIIHRMAELPPWGGLDFRDVTRIFITNTFYIYSKNFRSSLKNKIYFSSTLKASSNIMYRDSNILIYCSQ